MKRHVVLRTHVIAVLSVQIVAKEAGSGLSTSSRRISLQITFSETSTGIEG
jgi:hypothetical protein